MVNKDEYNIKDLQYTSVKYDVYKSPAFSNTSVKKNAINKCTNNKLPDNPWHQFNVIKYCTFVDYCLIIRPKQIIIPL